MILRPVMIAPLILLFLSLSVDIASAQVPARVETPYTLMDAESRTLLEGGAETPLRGNGPLTGYGYLFFTRPHFLDQDLYLRLVIPPGYLISELILDHWPASRKTSRSPATRPGGRSPTTCVARKSAASCPSRARSE